MPGHKTRGSCWYPAQALGSRRRMFAARNQTTVRKAAFCSSGRRVLPVRASQVARWSRAQADAPVLCSGTAPRGCERHPGCTPRWCCQQGRRKTSPCPSVPPGAQGTQAPSPAPRPAHRRGRLLRARGRQPWGCWTRALLPFVHTAAQDSAGSSSDGETEAGETHDSRTPEPPAFPCISYQTVLRGRLASRALPACLGLQRGSWRPPSPGSTQATGRELAARSGEQIFAQFIALDAGQTRARPARGRAQGPGADKQSRARGCGARVPPETRPRKQRGKGISYGPRAALPPPPQSCRSLHVPGSPALPRVGGHTPPPPPPQGCELPGHGGMEVHPGQPHCRARLLPAGRG